MIENDDNAIEEELFTILDDQIRKNVLPGVLKDLQAEVKNIQQLCEEVAIRIHAESAKRSDEQGDALSQNLTEQVSQFAEQALQCSEQETEELWKHTQRLRYFIQELQSLRSRMGSIVELFDEQTTLVQKALEKLTNLAEKLADSRVENSNVNAAKSKVEKQHNAIEQMRAAPIQKVPHRSNGNVNKETVGDVLNEIEAQLQSFSIADGDIEDPETVFKEQWNVALQKNTANQTKVELPETTRCLNNDMAEKKAQELIWKWQMELQEILIDIIERQKAESMGLEGDEIQRKIREDFERAIENTPLSLGAISKEIEGFVPTGFFNSIDVSIKMGKTFCHKCQAILKMNRKEYEQESKNMLNVRAQMLNMEQKLINILRIRNFLRHPINTAAAALLIITTFVPYLLIRLTGIDKAIRQITESQKKANKKRK